MWHSDQWYQGTVLDFDPVRKKHCIEYGDNGEHWCNMQSKLFYVVTPGPNAVSSVGTSSGTSNGETAVGGGADGQVSSSSSASSPSPSSSSLPNAASSTGEAASLPGVESKQEAPYGVRRGKLLSSSYAVAQSLVHFAYGENIQQVGYRTDAHLCVTKGEKNSATIAGSSLLYGEILPQGVTKA